MLIKLSTAVKAITARQLSLRTVNGHNNVYVCVCVCKDIYIEGPS